MVSRRQTLIGGLSALLGSTLRPALGHSPHSSIPTQLTASPAARPVARTIVAVVDGQFPASAFFARSMRLSGGSVRYIAGDITPIWMAFLGDRELREATFVGLTTPQSLFALHLMMQDAGFRLIHRVDQSAQADTARWGGRAASASLDAIALQRVQGPFQSCPSLCAGRSSGLVSWTIAPGGRYKMLAA